MASRSETDFAIHLPPPDDDGGSNENIAVTTRLVDAYRRRVRTREKQLAKAELVLAEWRAAVLDVVGEANWKKFVKFSATQRAGNFGLDEVRFDNDGLAKLAKAKRAQRARSVKLLASANLEPGGLKPIHRRYARQLDQVLRPRVPRKQRLEIVSEDKLPKGIQGHKSNPWTILTPPYAGWAWSYDWTRWGGGGPSLTRYLDSAVGGVGHRSHYWNYSAGDWDGLWLRYDTNVGVWYWPPHAGPVDVWVKARCARAYYNVWLDDEWGWSDSDTWMRSYFTVNVSPAHADEVQTQAWWSHTWGNPDSRTFSGDVIPANAVRWFHLVSDPIPANAWSYIQAGTHDSHISIYNDVSTSATMRNWWYIEEIWLDVH